MFSLERKRFMFNLKYDLLFLFPLNLSVLFLVVLICAIYCFDFLHLFSVPVGHIGVMFEFFYCSPLVDFNCFMRPKTLGLSVIMYLSDYLVSCVLYFLVTVTVEDEAN